jgi:hypothetical protein
MVMGFGVDDLNNWKDWNKAGVKGIIHSIEILGDYKPDRLFAKRIDQVLDMIPAN